MTYNEKKSLYESIMKDVSKIVKKKLNEEFIDKLKDDELHQERDFIKEEIDKSVEHLLDEAAVTYIELDRLTDAIDAVTQAIAMCDEHEDIRRYREVRFDGYLFLGRIYDMAGEYIKAEEAFAEAEKRVHDSPYEWKLPLCPEEIREKAKMIRCDMTTE